MKGRPAEHGAPATAWDYRRAITLVQVLAMNDPMCRQALVELAIAWDVVSDADVLFELSTIEIAHRLALHAQEHHGEQE